MRCPDCNKFTGLETQDPEVNSLDIDATGAISGTVTIIRQCSECGTDLKSADFEIDETVDPNDLPAPEGIDEHEHELSIEDVASEITDSWKGSRNLIGYSLTYRITCATCDLHHEGTVDDSMAAGSFEELV